MFELTVEQHYKAIAISNLKKVASDSDLSYRIRAV